MFSSQEGSLTNARTKELSDNAASRNVRRGVSRICAGAFIHDYDAMAVQPASLEVLAKAAVPPAQARAIVQAIEIEIAGAKDTLARDSGTVLRAAASQRRDRTAAANDS